MEFPSASPKPSLYELSTHSFIVKKPINEIWNLLTTYFDGRVVWNFDDKIMQCKTLYLFNLINFDIIVFKYNDEGSYIIEFRRMNGCRYSYTKFIDMISLELKFSDKHVYSMLLEPPEFPNNSYDKNILDTFKQIHNLIHPSKPLDTRIQNFKTFGVIKFHYTKEDGSVNSINLNTVEFVNIIKEAIVVYLNKSENEMLRLIALSSINAVIKFCNDTIQEPEWMNLLIEFFEKIKEKEYIESEDTLMKFEIKKGLRLMDEHNEITYISLSS
jgi:hypothetical protein